MTHDPKLCGCDYLGCDMWSCGHVDNQPEEPESFEDEARREAHRRRNPDPCTDPNPSTE